METLEPISMSTMVSLIVAVIALSIAVISVQASSKTNKRLNITLDLLNSLHKIIETNKTKIADLEEKLRTELQQVGQASQNINQSTIDEEYTAQLNQSIEALQVQIEQLSIQYQDLAEQEPAAKIYTKAQHLVRTGASVEEVMEACDLPRAEVEVMIGVQEKARK
jgi:exonuclease VII large subunit